MKPIPRVFIVCTGVGHINRGYESFTTECFENLKKSKNFELFLLKGAGEKREKHIKIPCIKRNSSTAELLSQLVNKEKYWIEEFTFLFGMLPSLIKYKPSVIYYSDFILGTFLWHLRRFFKFKYKLLFSNGAPNGPPFNTEDHVQQLVSVYKNDAVKLGVNTKKMTLLPYGFNINVVNNFFSKSQINEMKKKYGLPENKKIIISVGAINSHHKRMDYVIKEFSFLDDSEFFLLLLGQIDENTKPILELAKSNLSSNSYSIKQVSPKEVSIYLGLSDYFFLASLSEGFGRVLVEAQSYGLLPIVHDYEVARDVLKNYAVYGNLKENNVLLKLIIEVNNKKFAKDEIKNFAFLNYSWEKLTPKYEEMITKLL